MARREVNSPWVVVVHVVDVDIPFAFLVCAKTTTSTSIGELISSSASTGQCIVGCTCIDVPRLGKHIENSPQDEREPGPSPLIEIHSPQEEQEPGGPSPLIEINSPQEEQEPGPSPSSSPVDTVMDSVMPESAGPGLGGGAMMFLEGAHEMSRPSSVASSSPRGSEFSENAFSPGRRFRGELRYHAPEKERPHHRRMLGDSRMMDSRMIGGVGVPAAHLHERELRGNRRDHTAEVIGSGGGFSSGDHDHIMLRGSSPYDRREQFPYDRVRDYEEQIDSARQFFDGSHMMLNQHSSPMDPDHSRNNGAHDVRTRGSSGQGGRSGGHEHRGGRPRPAGHHGGTARARRNPRDEPEPSMRAIEGRHRMDGPGSGSSSSNEIGSSYYPGHGGSGDYDRGEYAAGPHSSGVDHHLYKNGRAVPPMVEHPEHVPKSAYGDRGGPIAEARRSPDRRRGGATAQHHLSRRGGRDPEDRGVDPKKKKKKRKKRERSPSFDSSSDSSSSSEQSSSSSDSSPERKKKKKSKKKKSKSTRKNRGENHQGRGRGGDHKKELRADPPSDTSFDSEEDRKKRRRREQKRKDRRDARMFRSMQKRGYFRLTRVQVNVTRFLPKSSSSHLHASFHVSPDASLTYLVRISCHNVLCIT